MPKNVVVCCDGTANEFAKHNTNVVKLFSVLRLDPSAQVAYYHPGLGTMEAPAALTTVARMGTKLLGMAIGYGLEGDVRDAYVYVMRSYQPGDRLFLFGFSRGAYTVRAVASLLHACGLLAAGNEPLVTYAIRMLTAIGKARGRGHHREAVKEYFDLLRGFKATFGRVECRPWFVGVWDTVSSVGWIANPLKLPYVADNPDIEVGRHAVAIDERRAFFRTHVWWPSPSAPAHGPRDLKQVWFPGVHCDVGGGYAEAESGLSKLALEWMLDEAEASGLLVDPARRRDVLGGAPGSAAPDPVAKAHESLKGPWRLAEFVPKKHFDRTTGVERWRMNLFGRRSMPDGCAVHEAALQRGDEYRSRLPESIIVVRRSSVQPV